MVYSNKKKMLTARKTKKRIRCGDNYADLFFGIYRSISVYVRTSTCALYCGLKQ